MVHRMALFVVLVAGIVLSINGLAAAQGVTGSGTPGTIPVWTRDGTMLTDSVIQAGVPVNINALLQVNGGVVGTSSSTAAGVFGQGGSGAGVVGVSQSSDGVIGQITSPIGSGVSGHSSAPGTNGVFGEATATSGFGDGVFGTSASGQGTGVYGQNTAPDSSSGSGVVGETMANTGFAPGVFGFAHNPSNSGVSGLNDSVTGNGASGVMGQATATSGFAYGVSGFAHGLSGVGVHGEAPFQGVLGISQDCNATGCIPTNGTGGQFTAGIGGNILVGSVAMSSSQWMTMFRVDTTGAVFADGGYTTGGADFAESMAVTGERSHYEPGDVVVIEENGNRQVALARQPYSTLVAGIYSTKPGVLATPYAIDDPRVSKEIPLAVVGIVPCKVTAENGAIKTGDLLVTSSVPGYAMKGTDRSRMLGAVVGKALEPLAAGRGVIQVLVTLQ